MSDQSAFLKIYYDILSYLSVTVDTSSYVLAHIQNCPHSSTDVTILWPFSDPWVTFCGTGWVLGFDVRDPLAKMFIVCCTVKAQKSCTFWKTIVQIIHQICWVCMWNWTSWGTMQLGSCRSPGVFWCGGSAVSLLAKAQDWSIVCSHPGCTAYCVYVCTCLFLCNGVHPCLCTQLVCVYVDVCPPGCVCWCAQWGGSGCVCLN